MDLFGIGTFTGKGIYDVDAFEVATGEAFPENHILSHDLIEGNFARCGLLTDTELFDDFPARYNAYARREHRWVRGDWQLLPWLGMRVPIPDPTRGMANPVPPAVPPVLPSPERAVADLATARRRNPLPVLERWKLLDNLRRSLVPAGAPAAAGAGLDRAARLAVGVDGRRAGGLPAAPVPDGAVDRDRQHPLGVAVAAAEVARDRAGGARSDRHGHRLPGLSVRSCWSTRSRGRWRGCSSAGASCWSGRRPRRPSSGWGPTCGTSSRGCGRRAGAGHHHRHPDRAHARPMRSSRRCLSCSRGSLSPGVAYFLSRPSAVAQHRADRAPIAGPCGGWRARPGCSSRRSSATPTTGSRPTISRRSPTAASRTGPRRPTWGCCCCRRCRRTTWATSARGGWSSGWRRRSRRSTAWRSTGATSTTGTRPRPCSRCRRSIISTVDSGNLLGCLIAMAHGLREKAQAPLVGPAVFQGLQRHLRPGGRVARRHRASRCRRLAALFVGPLPVDLAAVGLVAGSRSRPRRASWRAARGASADDAAPPATTWADRLVEQAGRVAGRAGHAGPVAGRDCATSRRGTARDSARPIPHGGGRRSARRCSPRPHCRPWSSVPIAWPPRSRRSSMTRPAPTARRSLRALADAVRDPRPAELLGRLRRLADTAEALADDMDFRPLYRPERHLFAIGYNLVHGRLDNACYDLMASECCLTSYLAVARGEAPRRHWFQLGRPFIRAAGRIGLISWGGTMFEYLMPRLLLRSLPGTLLAEACRTAVARQIEYGRELGLPWGISESGFSAQYLDGDYQYQAFGTPGPGAQAGARSGPRHRALCHADGHDARPPRGPGELPPPDPGGRRGRIRLLRGDRLHPRAAAAGASGRSSSGRTWRTTRGWAWSRLNNALHADVMTHRFAGRADGPRDRPAARGARSQRRADRRGRSRPTSRRRHRARPWPRRPIRRRAPTATPTLPAPAVAPMSRRLTTPFTPGPRTHLLSNTQYHVLLTNAGSGVSTCRGLDMTRWREDAAREGYGQFAYVRDVARGAGVVGRLPAGLPDARVVRGRSSPPTRPRSAAATWGSRPSLEVIVSPEHRGEVRRITLINHDTAPRELELTSYAEIVLAPRGADLGHPAFAKLFLETEWLPGPGAIICRRRMRSASEAPLWAVHVSAVDRSTRGGRRARRRPVRDRPGAVPRPRPDARRTRPRWTRAPSSRGRSARCSTRSSASADGCGSSRAGRPSWRWSPPSPSRAMRRWRWPTSSARPAPRPAPSSWPGRTARSSTGTHGRRRGHAPVPAAGVAHHLRRQRPAGRAVGASCATGWASPSSGGSASRATGRSCWCGSPTRGELPLARQLLAAHAYLRPRGLEFDLVLLDEEPGSYLDELNRQLARRRARRRRGRADRPARRDLRAQGVADERGRADPARGGGAGRAGRRARARSPASSTGPSATPRCPAGWSPTRDPGGWPDEPRRDARGPAVRQRHRAASRPTAASTACSSRASPPPRARPQRPAGARRPARHRRGLDAAAPAGSLGQRRRQPRPSASSPPRPGSGFTWAVNSQANRLTPWSNDPVSDPPGEVVYLRDEETGEVWSPTPLPVPSPAADPRPPRPGLHRPTSGTRTAWPTS